MVLPLDFARARHAALRERIQRDDPLLDEQTLADTLEGISDLHDAIAAIVRAALTDEALVYGLKDRIKEMQERLERLGIRASTRRQIARDAMVENDIPTINAADLTVSIRKGQPRLLIIDEAVIPASYWEPGDPKLNRQALMADLKDGGIVTGAYLSNAEPVLSVRSR